MNFLTSISFDASSNINVQTTGKPLVLTEINVRLFTHTK